MVVLGIDDTDMPGTLGTNQIARKIVQAATQWRCRFIVRHQLCTDPNIPCTSQNGSASIWLEPRGGDVKDLFALARSVLLENYVTGSDPGLCLCAGTIPAPIVDFARRTQREIVPQQLAHELAATHGLQLEGLGGTNGGVIGALAAIGLAATGDDGRIVQLGEQADDLRGTVAVKALAAINVLVLDQQTGRTIDSGTVDLVKKLRPNMRMGRAVLYVTPNNNDWRAVKLP
ncbi:MAG: hypothetical protein KDA58_08485 [Planctomycetaceae bacterium]|nr:hypothetical protein [Planctomycetaceae bacterium]